MHHKLRHYCRGQCADNGQAETFTPSVIQRSLVPEANLCGRCLDYQMNEFGWSYLQGRRHFLPFHEWIERESEEGIKRCTYCNLTLNTAYKLWVCTLGVLLH